MSERPIANDDLRTDMAVAIDGNILEGGRSVRPVAEDAEIYLVPSIRWGVGPSSHPPYSRSSRGRCVRIAGTIRREHEVPGPPNRVPALSAVVVDFAGRVARVRRVADNRRWGMEHP
jgi:hypothetical protein